MVFNALMVSEGKTVNDALRNLLDSKENLNVFCARCTADAVQIFGDSTINLAILDLDPELCDMLDLLKTIKQNWSFCYVIVYSERRDFETVYAITRYQKTNYLLKNDGVAALTDMISQTLQKIVREYHADELLLSSRRWLMEVNEIISDYITDSESHAALSSIITKGNIQSFLLSVDFENGVGSTNTMALIYRVIGHIRKNIFNPDQITLSYIADMVHFNPSYLSRLFKKVTNISISDYIMECKLVQAKHLLIDTDKKIHDIAESLGYASQSNFTRVFKKATGMTPNDFRSQSSWNGRHDEKKIRM